MSGVVRYGQAWVGNGYQIEAHPEGEWVRYADHAAKVAELQRLADAISRDCNDCANQRNAANARAEAAEGKLATAQAALRDDGLAISFQSFGQYRAAMLERCAAQLAEVVGRGE